MLKTAILMKLDRTVTPVSHPVKTYKMKLTTFLSRLNLKLPAAVCPVWSHIKAFPTFLASWPSAYLLFLYIFFGREFYFLPDFGVVDYLKGVTPALLPWLYLMVGAMPWFFTLPFFARILLIILSNSFWAYLVGTLWSPVFTLMRRANIAPYSGGELCSGLVASGKNWRWEVKWSDAGISDALRNYIESTIAAAQLLPDQKALCKKQLIDFIPAYTRAWQKCGPGEARHLLVEHYTFMHKVFNTPTPTYSYMRWLSKPISAHLPGLANWIEAHPHWALASLCVGSCALLAGVVVGLSRAGGPTGPAGPVVPAGPGAPVVPVILVGPAAPAIPLGPIVPFAAVEGYNRWLPRSSWGIPRVEVRVDSGVLPSASGLANFKADSLSYQGVFNHVMYECPLPPLTPAQKFAASLAPRDKVDEFLKDF
jgi:hypothetical protein